MINFLMWFSLGAMFGLLVNLSQVVGFKMKKLIKQQLAEMKNNG